MTEDEILEEIHERIAQGTYQSLDSDAKRFASTYQMAFHDQIDEYMTTPEGQMVVARMREEILAEGRPSLSDTGPSDAAGRQPSVDDFGPNGAQIRALYDWLASLDNEAWLGLLFASALLGADPQAASPENREMVKRIRGAKRTADEVTTRVRKNAMASRVWPAIEASVIATSGAQIGLAIDVAKRLNPSASPEDLAKLAPAYAEPIGGLTHALRLRPYVSEQEFVLLWGIYEMSDHRLAEIRLRLPPLKPSPSIKPLGTTAQSGGCLLSAVVAMALLVDAVTSILPHGRED